MRIWYLSPMPAAKVQASLRIRAVSSEPPLLAHKGSESRGTSRQKARSLAPLNGWACAVEICHDGMLEDTNSLDAALLMSVFPFVWISAWLVIRAEIYTKGNTNIKCGASSEFVFSSIPSWQILTAHAQPFNGARDLVFCLKVPLDSLLVWASSTKFAWRGPNVVWSDFVTRTKPYGQSPADKIYAYKETQPKAGKLFIYYWHKVKHI